MNNVSVQIDRLQELVIENLIKELESGDTTNISVANTMLTANKVIVKQSEGETQHKKVKRVMKK
jgi:HKD family nuclease